MEHKTVLITGATSGIGYATARILVERSWHVILTSRDVKRGEQVKAELSALNPQVPVDLVELDLASLASVKKAIASIKSRFSRLDVLINNAGASYFTRQVTQDGYEATWATNHAGPFVFTNGLLDLLRASSPSRIINVASTALARPSMDDLQNERSFQPMNVYAQSKAANLLFTGALARRLAGTGVTVNAVHPGVVQTRLIRDARGIFRWMFALMRPLFLTPERGAQTSIYAATAAELEHVTGQFFVKNKSTASTYLTDIPLQDQLWNASERFQQGLKPSS